MDKKKLIKDFEIHVYSPFCEHKISARHDKDSTSSIWHHIPDSLINDKYHILFVFATVYNFTQYVTVCVGMIIRSDNTAIVDHSRFSQNEPI